MVIELGGFDLRQSSFNHDTLRSEFSRNGFVYLPSPFTADQLRSWRQEVDRLGALVASMESERPEVDRRQTLQGDAIPERIDPVTGLSPVFFRLARHPLLLELAETLLDDEPLLFKDKLILKTPGTLGYPLHQDYAYIDFFGFSGDQQLAIAIALDEARLDSGPIEFFPGCHHARLPSPENRPGEVDLESIEGVTGQRVEMGAGDMVVFSSLCPHRSAPNHSNSGRSMLFFTYNARSSGDYYAQYYRMGKP